MKRLLEVNEVIDSKRHKSFINKLTYFDCLSHDLRCEVLCTVPYRQTINISTNISAFSFLLNNESTYANKYWQRKLSVKLNLAVDIFKDVSIEYIRKVLSKGGSIKHALFNAIKYGYVSIIQQLCSVYAGSELFPLNHENCHQYAPYFTHYYDMVLSAIDYCQIPILEHFLPLIHNGSSSIINPFSVVDSALRNAHPDLLPYIIKVICPNGEAIATLHQAALSDSIFSNNFEGFKYLLNYYENVRISGKYIYYDNDNFSHDFYSNYTTRQMLFNMGFIHMIINRHYGNFRDYLVENNYITASDLWQYYLEYDEDLISARGLINYYMILNHNKQELVDYFFQLPMQRKQELFTRRIVFINYLLTDTDVSAHQSDLESLILHCIDTAHHLDISTMLTHFVFRNKLITKTKIRNHIKYMKTSNDIVVRCKFTYISKYLKANSAPIW